MPQYVPKIRGFTGDTGKTLDWQIGFEDPVPPRSQYRKGPSPNGKDYYNFLGIGEGKQNEDKKRSQALADVRKKIPAATSCADAQTKLATANKELAIQTSISQGVSHPESILINDMGWAPRYIYALNVVIPEFINYVNSNCLTTTTAAGPSVNTDPIAQTASPSVNQSPSAIAGQPASGAAPSAVSSLATSVTTTVKTIPSWVWWTGGGLLALIIVVAIIKRKES